jgi:transcription elongation factor Elf1
LAKEDICYEDIQIIGKSEVRIVIVIPNYKKEEMPSGDAQRQWFPEMIEMLRQQWHPGLSLAGLALLAVRLDTILQQIRKDRNIIPPMFTCPKCSERERSSFGRISVNAIILAAGRFRVASEADIKELSKRWKKYSKEHDLDHYRSKVGKTTA